MNVPQKPTDAVSSASEYILDNFKPTDRIAVLVLNRQQRIQHASCVCPDLPTRSTNQISMCGPALNQHRPITSATSSFKSTHRMLRDISTKNPPANH